MNVLNCIITLFLLLITLHPSLSQDVDSTFDNVVKRSDSLRILKRNKGRRKRRETDSDKPEECTKRGYRLIEYGGNFLCLPPCKGGKSELKCKNKGNNYCFKVCYNECDLGSPDWKYIPAKEQSNFQVCLPRCEDSKDEEENDTGSHEESHSEERTESSHDDVQKPEDEGEDEDGDDDGKSFDEGIKHGKKKNKRDRGLRVGNGLKKDKISRKRKRIQCWTDAPTSAPTFSPTQSPTFESFSPTSAPSPPYGIKN